MAKGHGSEPTMHHADLQFSLPSEFARHLRVTKICNTGLFYIAWEHGGVGGDVKISWSRLRDRSPTPLLLLLALSAVPYVR